MATILRRPREGFVPAGVQAANAAPVSAAWLPGACDDVRIMAFRDATRSGHALIATGDVLVRVNGFIVVGGLCVLDHKDELMVRTEHGTEQMFFSAESVPVAELFHAEGSKRRPRCPICRDEIHDGQRVVRCPGCSRLHHQIDATDELPAKHCWTYLPACRFCEHPTSMSGEPTWRPDEEEFS